jgi:hypothetical protein
VVVGLGSPFVVVAAASLYVSGFEIAGCTLGAAVWLLMGWLERLSRDATP